ncbi:MAG: hypothetical protein V4576_01065, partial [Patescibacteria group bacterium]
ANQTISATKGSTAAYRLTNNNVLVNSVSFQNLTATTTDGTMRVTINVSYNNTANDSRLNYSTTLISTVTLR